MRACGVSARFASGVSSLILFAVEFFHLLSGLRGRDLKSRLLSGGIGDCFWSGGNLV